MRLPQLHLYRFQDKCIGFELFQQLTDGLGVGPSYYCFVIRHVCVRFVSFACFEAMSLTGRTIVNTALTRDRLACWRRSAA